MKLTGNTILITGGTAGIGRSLALALNELGNKVIICGRRLDRLEEIHSDRPDIEIIECDVADEAQRNMLAEKIHSDFPAINVLINNAGMQLAHDLTAPLDIRSVNDELNTNFVAPVHLTSLIIPIISNNDAPAIINISSGLAFTPLAFMPIYCASKAALHSWSMSLRAQLKEVGVKVYEVAPPSVDTELGYQRRSDKTQSHGGMPVNEFVDLTIEALKTDQYQVGIGPAAKMMSDRDEFFDQLNSSI